MNYYEVNGVIFTSREDAIAYRNSLQYGLQRRLMLCLLKQESISLFINHLIITIMKRYSYIIDIVLFSLASAFITWCVMSNKVTVVETQRDLLSDAIRSWDDQDDKEDLSIMQSVDYYLEDIGLDHTVLGEWVYCY